MAPAMPKQRAVHLPDNEEVARLLLEKHRSMLETNIPDNLSLTLSNAYRNVCAAKEPIRTLKDLLKIKGVGPWVIRLIKESFPVSTQDLSPPKCKEKGRKGKKIKRPEHNPELVCSNSASMASQELIQLTSQEQFSYSSEVRTDSNCSENIILSGPDSDEPFKGNNPFIGPEHFVEERDRPKLKACSSSFLDISKGPATNFGASDCSVPVSPLSSQGTFELQSSSTMGSTEFTMLDKDTGGMGNSILAMPPCLSNEMFLEVYEVVLILDDREIFGSVRLYLTQESLSRGKRVVDNIHSKFHVPVEVGQTQTCIKRLPVGDCIWIARHRRSHTEYVLDFIVERKSVTDLVSSIRDSRYKDQKLRLKKCGLRKLIYLVEGDPNPLGASESIKTACFTSEILEGFDVQRTTGYSDTERTYGHLTLSIIDYYSMKFSIGANTSRVCLTYDEFVKKCCDPKKLTVSDIFALQLMQVPQVTEETAIAVIELYPTLVSLARAYSMLDGDSPAQEKMLNMKSKMVNAGASRNIFKLVWGEG
ncbi:crossover junction endonuclease MUS81-like isoform X1 [Hordeum vulgare subsp. vulgare]|uniref:crossover junction endonuclease MUS81-like isoform X1 n=1 Tax=Hordeum vulgare subsp. vulgare TaxID=112509 RepID=UPI001D1A3D1F|nr:crossover junction endonuclease MUS81-like isoform X1 [Hordeum vulgare subsp. vulgare]